MRFVQRLRSTDTLLVAGFEVDVGGFLAAVVVVGGATGGMEGGATVGGAGTCGATTAVTGSTASA